MPFPPFMPLAHPQASLRSCPAGQHFQSRAASRDGACYGDRPGLGQQTSLGQRGLTWFLVSVLWLECRRRMEFSLVSVSSSSLPGRVKAEHERPGLAPTPAPVHGAQGLLGAEWLSLLQSYT